MSVPLPPAPPPERFDTAGGLTGDGRIGRGIDLARRSWEYLRAHPPLLALPAMSAAATALAALLIFAPVMLLTEGWDYRVSVFAAGAASALPFILVSTFFNVGFLGMVNAYRRGEKPSIRDGLRFATRRWRVIAAWSLIAALVGTLLSALQQLPVFGDWLGRLIGWLGGLAWALATFFVVPVLVVEELGVRAAVRRSAAVFKARWGEAVTGDVAIAVVLGLLSIPFWFAGAAGIAAYPDHPTTGAALAGIGLVGIAAGLALANALTQFFQLALYEHAVAERIPAPFTEADMRAAVKAKEPPFWKG